MKLLKRVLGNRVSFRVYLLELFLILFLFYATVVTLVSYGSTSKIIDNAAFGNAQEFTNRVREQVKDHIGEAAQATRIIASFLQANETYRDIPQNTEFLWSLIWPLMQNPPSLHSLHIGSEKGDFLQVRRLPKLSTRVIVRSVTPPLEKWIYRKGNYEQLNDTQLPPEFDHRKRDWYLQTGGIPRSYWSKPYEFNADGKEGITVSYPVLDNEGKIDLVVAADISLEKISEFLNQKPVTENSIAGVIDASGRVIAAPVLLKAETKRNQVFWLQQLQPKIYENFQKYILNPQDVYYIDNKGSKEDWLINFKSIDVLDWYVVTEIPRADLTRRALTIVNKMLLFSLLAFLVMILLIYLVTRRVSRPLIQISKETKRLKNFDLEGIRPVSSNIAEIELVSGSLLSSVGALKAFRSYLPAELVRQLVEQGKGGELGGEQFEITIFFSDIADFATVSEGLDPKHLMIQLSEYFEVVTQIIMANEGTVDKYIGDSVMAFWGAPSAVSEAAMKACHVALEAQKDIEKLNSRWVTEGKPRFNTRIGLHTGEAIIGNVGSSERMNYSAIGDSVNLASRLEGLNKDYDTQIIISEATWLQVHDRFECRPLDEVLVKGKTKPVKVFELVREI